jgi:hypothetical protein
MSNIWVEPDWPQMAIYRRIACWVNTATRAQTHASTCAPTPTRTHSSTYAPSLPPHTHTHTETGICNIYYFPRQQWFRERVSVLRYTYISCLLVSAPFILYCLIILRFFRKSLASRVLKQTVSVPAFSSGVEKIILNCSVLYCCSYSTFIGIWHLSLCCVKCDICVY